MKKKLLLFSVISIFVMVFVGLVLAHEDSSNMQGSNQGTEDSQSDKLENDLKDDLGKLKEKNLDKSSKTKEKETIKADVLTKLKKVVENLIDRAIKKYQRLRERVSNMKVIADDKKQTIYAKIDAEIAKLNQEKQAIENASTIEEVRALLAGIKQDMKDNKDLIEATVKEIHANHLANIVDKLRTILADLDSQISALKSQGKDVAELENLSGQAKTLLDSAATEAKSYDFKKAKEDILNARMKMIGIASKIKALKGEEE